MGSWLLKRPGFVTRDLLFGVRLSVKERWCSCGAVAVAPRVRDACRDQTDGVGIPAMYQLEDEQRHVGSKGGHNDKVIVFCLRRAWSVVTLMMSQCELVGRRGTITLAPETQ